MKHFKKADGLVLAFESDGSQDHLITEDMTPISDSDLAALRASQTSPAVGILVKIAILEASITSRRLREALLSGDKSFIEQVDAEIAVLRGQL